MNKPINLNREVSTLLDGLQHPLRDAIELLRTELLNTDTRLTENIKWNAPNYSLNGGDRITMRIQPASQLQLIFHRGAKVLEEPKNKLIADPSGILLWRTNDRAIATFKNKEDVAAKRAALKAIVRDWLEATTS